MSEPYDQRKKDPEGYFLSFAFIFGLVALGSLLDFLSEGGAIGIAALVAGAAAYIFLRLASTERQEDYDSGRFQDPKALRKKSDL